VDVSLQAGIFGYHLVQSSVYELLERKTVGKRNLASADRVAKSCVRHIDNPEPRVFFIENPRARLRKRPFMRRFLELTHICTPCKYGRPFKKESDICTKICAEDLRLRRRTASPPCVYVKRFEKKYGKKRHPQTAQTGGTYDKDLKITIPGTPSKKSAEIAPRLAEHLVHRSLAYMKEQGHDRFPKTR
jgi:hypothetical protein